MVLGARLIHISCNNLVALVLIADKHVKINLVRGHPENIHGDMGGGVTARSVKSVTI